VDAEHACCLRDVPAAIDEHTLNVFPFDARKRRHSAVIDLTMSRGRFTDDDPAGDRVLGGVERVVSSGLSVDGARPVYGSLRLRYFGPRALVEDGSVRSQATTLVNGEIGYRFSRRIILRADVFNLFDREVSDIDYFYASRLSGEPEDGVEDVHTHPALPRSARLTLHVDF